MNFKSLVLSLVIIFVVTIQGRSQSLITLDGSQVFSNFKFIDSQGKRDNDYKNVLSGGYSLGYRFIKKGFFVRVNLGMRKGGSSLAYNGSNIVWNLQYADVRLGIGYELNKWKLKPYLSVAPYYSILLKATQNMDGLNTDIMQNKSIKTSDYGILAIPGLRFAASDYVSIYTEFTYLMGLQNNEAAASKQKLYNTGYSVSLGIALTITKTQPQWLKAKK